ncbi:hypothetical protein ANOM_002692 [Aspergillus nomiae NRRL 13137]|uniref:NmrA-like domain-containing protein n=1 Tax=Aspergillus nomiae NRRL (strain ATCC 15546 / NRRL 13137 / CBS 260.88 / M93) TaxID=1509407 RepID=A0A0L1JA28_ASPN3|nr:uncharacterized protein ANOM_002692 [Aspergillus nomiae NRRL 13137]KNG88567.1 hypothetical protein ANOM_002692 [Aspergillus nomiae NRRL 13137]
MSAVNVSIVGGTGNIGKSIVNALLSSENQDFRITALVRPQSIEKPEVVDIRSRGIRTTALDLGGSEHDLVKALEDTHVLIVCLPPRHTSQEIKLIDAASKAGVKRFVPSAWAVTAPPNDLMKRDWKEAVYAHMKKVRLPYTIIDTGVWHEVVIPRVPSGKLDHAALMGRTFLVGQGETPCATTAIQDIGRFVASIIVDPRTLNRYVFAYGEHVTQNQYIALAREITGEAVPYIPVSQEKVVSVAHQPETADFQVWQKVIVQYLYNNWVKGDSETSYAKYLGYLDAHDLYPEFKVKPLSESMREAFSGGEDFAAQVGDDSFWVGLEKLLLEEEDR